MKAFRALFWKEYRQQVALVVALVILCLLIQLSMTLMYLWSNYYSTPFFATAMLMTALYAAGAGAILFSREHEERTFMVLRSLPISAPFLAWGKISWLLASTVAVGVSTALLSVPWALALGDTSGPNVVLACGVGIVEGLCWSLFWSPRTKNQLNALLCTFFSISIGMQICTALYGYFYQITPASSPQIYGDAWWFRLLLAVPVGVVGLYGSLRWLTQTDTPRAVDTTTEVKSQARGTLANSPFLSLCWITFRQSRILISTAWIISLLFSIWIIWDIMRGVMAGGDGVIYNRSDYNDSEIAYMLWVVIPLFLIVYCGSVFFTDQKEKGTRLLAHCGVSPKKIWWSRILVFGSAFFPLAIALLWITIAAWPHFDYRMMYLAVMMEDSFYRMEHTYNPIRDRMDLYYLPVLLSMFLFCIGQMVSLFLRSGIVGIVATGMVGIVLLFTTAMLGCFFGNRAFLILVMLPLLCLLASRLRVDDWLRTRNRFRIWIRPLLVVLIPLGCIFAMVPPYRIWSVPNINMGYHIDETNLNKPVDQRKFNWAFGSFRPDHTRLIWIEDRENSDARHRRYLMSRGEFTPEKYKEHQINFQKPWIKRLENNEDLFPFIYDNRRISLLEMNRVIFEYEQRIVRTGFLPNEEMKDPRRTRANLFMLMPWEKTRYLKMLNVQFQNASQSIVLMENALFDKTVPFDDAVEQTAIAKRFGGGYMRGIDEQMARSLWCDFATGSIVYQRELNRRISILEAALQLWYLEHGSLPDSLDDLKDVYIKEIPLVPGFEIPFVYHPDPEKVTPEERSDYYWINWYSKKEKKIPFIYAPIPSKKWRVLQQYANRDLIRFLNFALNASPEEETQPVIPQSPEDAANSNSMGIPGGGMGIGMGGMGMGGGMIVTPPKEEPEKPQPAEPEAVEPPKED